MNLCSCVIVIGRWVVFLRRVSEVVFWTCGWSLGCNSRVEQ